jgi:glycine/D-amino acid oxidase-like deaminating enzyme
MRVIVIGAGIVGASCAYHLAAAGCEVVVVDRSGPASGTTAAGEGNLLVSDKVPGPELDLALASNARWHALAEELGEATGEAIELDRKGGVVVTASAGGLAGLQTLTTRQRTAGVDARDVAADDLLALEPHLAPGMAGGAHYPQDAQLQPMLATAHLLRAARRRGAAVRYGTEVAGLLMAAERVTGVATAAGELHADAVVNAAGTWGGTVARMAGVDLPVLPRRGFILVTEPLPPMVRHKVYGADYVAAVGSDDAGLETSPVVEGTRAGTVLIGSTRERVDFDRSLSPEALRRLAASAIGLFPFLAQVRALRCYHGFRPYCPDHLPTIGVDPRAPGLVHACGHEGAGIGLAAITGQLVAEQLLGREPAVDLRPFRPDRFAEVAA